MLIYVVNMASIFLVWIIIQILPLKDKDLIYCWIIGIELTLISAFRYGIGTDYFSYELQYGYINNRGNLLNAISYYYFEPAYNLLNYIAGFTPWGFKFVVAVSSFIINTCTAICIYKYSGNKLISFFLYIALDFYAGGFCLIRQYMAMVIAFMALPYLLERKFIRVLIIVAFAAQFHQAVWIIIPFYFVATKLLNIKQVFLIVCLCALTYCLWDIFISLAFNLFPKYALYLNSKFIYGKNFNSIIPYLFLMFIMILYRKRLLRYDKRNIIYINAAFYAFVLSLFQTKIGILDRLPNVLNFYIIWGIPAIENSYSNSKKNEIIFNYFVFFVGGIWFLYSLVKDYSNVIPYKSIFG